MSTEHLVRSLLGFLGGYVEILLLGIYDTMIHNLIFRVIGSLM